MDISPETIINQMLDELRNHSDPRTIKYHKEEDARTPNVNNHSHIGVKIPIIRDVGKRYFQILKDKGMKDIDSVLDYCDFLLEKRISELRVIAFQWSFKVQRQYRAEHFYVFYRWILHSLSGWGSCDDLCTHSVPYHLIKFPQFVDDYKKLTSSENPWARRASAVTFIIPVRKKLFFEHVFDISNALMHDKEDLVLKGYGWLLKEATRHYQNEVYEYVLYQRENMPRVALRYAIEKFPKEMRLEAMKK